MNWVFSLSDSAGVMFFRLIPTQNHQITSLASLWTHKHFIHPDDGAGGMGQDKGQKQGLGQGWGRNILFTLARVLGKT